MACKEFKKAVVAFWHLPGKQLSCSRQLPDAGYHDTSLLGFTSAHFQF